MSFDVMLFEQLEHYLDQYPSLKACFPQKWPRDPGFEITAEKLRIYSEMRQRKFWEQINFPLLLHNLFNLELRNDLKSLQVFRSMLNTLEIFAQQLGGLPGAKKILHSLWDEAWSDQPRFWSVMSETALALFLQSREFKICGFEEKINNSDKRADIKTIWRDKVCWVDIEGLSLTKDISGTNEDFRRLVAGRAKNKLQDKYVDVQKDQYAIVASVYRPGSNNVARFRYENEALKPVTTDYPNVFAHVYWFVTGKWPHGEHVLALVDYKTVTSPLSKALSLDES